MIEKIIILTDNSHVVLKFSVIRDRRTRCPKIPNSGLPVVFIPEHQDENWNELHSITFLNCVKAHNIMILPRFPLTNNKTSADPRRPRHKRHEFLVLSFDKHDIHSLASQLHS